MDTSSSRQGLAQLRALWDSLARRLLGSTPDAGPPTEPSLDLANTLHATCAACGVEVDDKVRAFCLGHPERFEGRVYCYEHQRDHRGGAA